MLTVVLIVLAQVPSVARACVTCGSSESCMEVVGDGALGCSIEYESTEIECGLLWRALGICGGTRTVKSCKPVGACEASRGEVEAEADGSSDEDGRPE